jgi:hypothetical protein
VQAVTVPADKQAEGVVLGCEITSLQRRIEITKTKRNHRYLKNFSQ